jgi:hypothetical protein
LGQVGSMEGLWLGKRGGGVGVWVQESVLVGQGQREWAAAQ